MSLYYSSALKFLQVSFSLLNTVQLSVEPQSVSLIYLLELGYLLISDDHWEKGENVVHDEVELMQYDYLTYIWLTLSFLRYPSM